MIDASAAGPKKNYYQLEQFFPRQSAHPGPRHDALRRARLRLETVILLQALAAPHMPQWAALSRVDSIDAYLQDRHEPPCEPYSTALFEMAPNSSNPTPAERGRIFELRVYHSPNWRQLAALHKCFVGPEIKIFHRAGVHPILYSATLIGPNRTTLAYLIPFDSLVAREKAWNAFAADEEWIKFRKESLLRHGRIADLNQIAIFEATDYSPVR